MRKLVLPILLLAAALGTQGCVVMAAGAVAGAAVGVAGAAVGGAAKVAGAGVRAVIPGDSKKR